MLFCINGMSDELILITNATAIIAAKIFKIEADRTDQLVGFMLKRFLDIHD